MSRIIRWPGVTGFLVIVVGLAVFFMLFFDSLARSALTAVLTRVNQAEANIERLEVTWSPFAVDIHNIQLTNPDEPDYNRFSATSLRAQVQFLNLLIGKVHIDDLTAAGVDFHSKRAKTGKVLVPPEPEQSIPLRERLAALNIELPTAESFLAGANITTPDLVKAVETNFNQRQQAFEAARDNLPSREAFEDYKKRVQALLDSKPKSVEELLAAREELNRLKEEIKADKAGVDNFLMASETLVTATQADLAEVKATYQADLDRARALFRLDADALTELSGILFGAQVEVWAQYALMAFDFIAPLLENAQQQEQAAALKPSRWQGRYIDFETQSSPDFLIKNAHLSVNVVDVALLLELTNVTWQHERIQAPTLFQVQAEQGASQGVGWESFQLAGDLFIDHLGQVLGQQEWQLIGARLDQLTLLESSNLQAVMTQAGLNSHGSLVFAQGQFKGVGDLSFSNTDFAISGEGKMPYYLGQALSAVQNFDLSLGLSGQLTQPSIQISSNLDQQLGAQFNRLLASEAEAQLNQVRSSLSAQSDGVLSKIEPWLTQVQKLQAEGKNLDESFAELLNAEMGNLVETGGARLLDRIRSKVFN